jgi:flagellar biosynthesis/type III secretory pathway M-ring protein FliF/YscJ
MNLQTLLARLLAAPPRTKFTLGAIVLGVCVLIAGAFGATRDNRVALFALPLKADQLAEVEERLAGWNIPYAPSTDNVRVEKGGRAGLLLKLSIAGVPHAHLAGSQEILAQAGALTPQSVLDVQSRDGLAADLALGLRGLEGVADARVIIAPAHTGMYADEASHDASASVRITLSSGARLNARTIAGIKAFIAGGVPALDPERVTVLDDRGLVLDGDTTASADSVQTALQSALDLAFGAGGTIVRVHREALGERRDIHDVRRTPLAGAIARSSSDERYASSQKKYSKENSVEDRGSDTHDERHLALPGSMERLSVAVFVDTAKSLDINKIRSLAQAAAGVDPARGDTISVESVRFAVQPVPLVVRFSPWIITGAFAGIVPQAIVAIAICLALVLGAKPAYALTVRVLETASVRATTRHITGIPPVRVRGALAGEPPHIAAAIISALPAATATAVLEMYPAEERAAIVRRLSRAASPLLPDAEELCERAYVRG